MPAAAHALHDDAHIDPVDVASTDHNATLLTLIDEDAESRIHIDDFPEHPNHDGQAVHVPPDIHRIDAGGDAVDFNPPRILQHFKQHIFLFFSVGRP